MENSIKNISREYLQGSRVLIVDDSLMNCEIIVGFLKKAGLTSIETAKNGEEALTKIGSFLPHVVLLDIQMPVMDGYECLRRLRADPAHKHIPVIVQTGVDDVNEKMKVFDVGATDLIFKPINFQELITRIKVHLERHHLLQKLQEYFDQNEEELEISQKMQRGILPSQKIQDNIQNHYGIKLENHFEPSSYLGGDIWGMRPIDEDRFAVYIVDFSGHGVTAALNTFRLHTILEQMTDEWLEPEKILFSINNILYRLLPRGQFATMLYGIVDTRKSTFDYASAAAPPFFLGNENTDEIIQCDTTGTPIGFLPNSQYDVRSIDFPTGSHILLYSDGLTEARGSDDSLLEEERAIKMMLKSYGAPNKESFIKEMMNNFNKWSPARPLNDDLTMVWMQR